MPLDGLPFADDRAIADAVRTVPACTGCHADLDPIASFYFGFVGTPGYSDVVRGCEDGTGCYPLPSWDSASSGDWAAAGLPAPAWFGAPGNDLGDLGRLIAADPRFATCAARRFLGWYTQVLPADVSADDADLLAAKFVASGENARTLARAAVDTAAFRNAGPLPIRPEALSRMLEDLTGYTWTDDAGTDLIQSDATGWRTLGGGMDSYYVTRRDPAPTGTKMLVLARAAERAAEAVVDHDLAEPDRAARRLLTEIDADEDGQDAPGEDSVRAQLSTLHLRILGEFVAIDDPEVDATWRLFDNAWRRGGTARAWKVVIAAMLQDGRVAWY